MNPPRNLKSNQVHILMGEQVETYVAVVSSLLRKACLNKFFPDPKGLLNFFKFFSPSVNLGLYQGVELNIDTGLPSEKDTIRLITDKELVPSVLRGAQYKELSENFGRNPTEVNRRRMLRFEYHQELDKAPLPLMSHLGIELRSIDDKNHTAYFTVTFDRFDLCGGLFTRYTILFHQIDSRWTRPQIELSGDDFSFTENFRNVISRYTADESEFAFVLLNDLKGIFVEEVMRARFGPLYFQGIRSPQGISRLVDEVPGCFILSLPTDRTSTSIKEERNLDPFAMFYRDFLERGAREVYDEKARLLGFHVFKDRKFVCTNNVASRLRSFLKKIGAKNIVSEI